MTTFAVILAVLWLIGVATGSSWGGLIHLLLAAALAVVMIQFVRGWFASEGSSSDKRRR